MRNDMSRISRRNWLKTASVLGAGALILPQNFLARGQSPNSRLNIALIGLGNQGKFQVGGMKGQNVVAIVDCDQRMMETAVTAFPSAKKFADFRKMYDEMEQQIDAVCVSTPDHTHYHPAIRAIRAKKHLYLEKPMAHSVAECRIITDEAAKMGVATQLGCQRHAIPNMHRVVELVQSGAIGDVTEVYSWIGGDRGMPALPEKTPAAPAELDWNLWLGPAKERPYSTSTVTSKTDQPTYAPYNWRFWWDFGTGETGNWACHILDIPYWALDLKYPTHVSATGPEVDSQRTPTSMHCIFKYPSRGKLPALVLHWMHTKNPVCKEKYGLADSFDGGKIKFSEMNNLFVGTKGMLLAGFSKHVLLPENKFTGFKYPAPFIPDSPGFHREWINACLGGTPATCNFSYSGPMAETAILGNTAFRAGHKSFDWDAEKMIAVNCPEVQAALKPEFRQGWSY